MDLKQGYMNDQLSNYSYRLHSHLTVYFPTNKNNLTKINLNIPITLKNRVNICNTFNKLYLLLLIITLKLNHIWAFLLPLINLLIALSHHSGQINSHFMPHKISLQVYRLLILQFSVWSCSYQLE